MVGALGSKLRNVGGAKKDYGFSKIEKDDDGIELLLVHIKL
jgi:hypothetical protein